MQCTNQFNLRADPEIGQFSFSIVNGECSVTNAFGGAALDNTAAPTPTGVNIKQSM